MDDRLLQAAVAAGLGLVVGLAAAVVARRLLGDDRRPPALRAIAQPLARFLFWIGVIGGLIVALSVTRPDTLDGVPADLLGWLPNLLAAGLLVFAASVLGGVLAVAVGGAIRRATGARSTVAERAIRWGIVSAGVVLALGNLGVRTTSLQIVVAGVVFGLALTLALLAGLGGREVAGAIALGRSLGSDLRVGDEIVLPDGRTGTICALRPAHAVVRVEATRIVISHHDLFRDGLEIVDTD